VSSSRARRTVVAAAFLSAGLALSGCGATVDQAGGSGGGTPAESCVDTSGPNVKIGFLNSRSGTMAISENTVYNSLKMAADQINGAGGVLGKQLTIVAEDGASEPTVFAEKAEKLIRSDCTAAVFGGWTSSSRKAMLPVFEGNDALLFYPVQYEGLESSKNIFYTGATTNQQIVPALDYLKEKGAKSLFLVGSDYVFPQTANKIIKAYAAANGMEIKGEEYAPLGYTDFATIVAKVRDADADAVFNTLNGDSNVAFFKEYKNLGLTADAMPVLSVSIAEEEVGGIGVDNIVGQPVAWNYYQTLQSPENQKFVSDFKTVYGADKVTSDPMEAAYTSLYLWKGMVEKANSFAVPDVQAAAGGVSYAAPEGAVTVNGDNHHIAKTALIGKIGPDGLIYTDWTSGAPIEPDPYLKSYPWASSLAS
jgi:urea transport system substrate-binding protein